MYRFSALMWSVSSCWLPLQVVVKKFRFCHAVRMHVVRRSQEYFYFLKNGPSVSYCTSRVGVTYVRIHLLFFNGPLVRRTVATSEFFLFFFSEKQPVVRSVFMTSEYFFVFFIFEFFTVRPRSVLGLGDVVRFVLSLRRNKTQGVPTYVSKSVALKKYSRKSARRLHIRTQRKLLFVVCCLGVGRAKSPFTRKYMEQGL